MKVYYSLLGLLKREYKNKSDGSVAATPGNLKQDLAFLVPKLKG